MFRIHRQFLASLTIILFSISLCSQEGQPSPQTAAQPASQRTDSQREEYHKAMEQADQKIADEVTAHSELIKNLEYLTTQIGARLTGSPQMQAASDWPQKGSQHSGMNANRGPREM